jgi:excisionase family DNA binding protein
VTVVPRSERVYTVSEVAAALRVSNETIRRKISAGELRAIEIGGGSRRQYRILARDLAAWLGPEEARALFGVGEGLEALRAIFMPLSETERERLIAKAVRWAREHMPEPEPSGRTVSPEEIAARFKRAE